MVLVDKDMKLIGQKREGKGLFLGFFGLTWVGKDVNTNNLQ